MTTTPGDDRPRGSSGFRLVAPEALPEGAVIAGRPVAARGPRSLKAMAMAMVVTLAFVGVLVAITLRPAGQQVRVVDYRQTLAEARQGAPFDVLAPEGLPAGWRATSAWYDPPPGTGTDGAVWHLGFLSPTDQYVGFEQTNGPADGQLNAYLPDRDRQGTSVVNGQTYQRFVAQAGSKERRALLTTVAPRSGADGTGAPVIALVHGSADWPELEAFASALRAG